MEGEVLVSKGATLCTFREHSHSLTRLRFYLLISKEGFYWGEDW